jgi:hypothetical protein
MKAVTVELDWETAPQQDTSEIERHFAFLANKLVDLGVKAIIVKIEEKKETK